VLNSSAMKQYIIDDLRLEDYYKLKAYLDRYLLPSPIDGIYWLKVDENILSPLQKDHHECKPHIFALMLEEASLSCELLVRTEKKIKCDCMCYADREQRNWLMDQADAILEKLDIQI
jgi:hypothetical protein